MDKYIEWEKEASQEDTKFKINSLDKANWAFRKIKENNDYIERMESLKKEEIKRIEQWFEDETKSLKYTNESFRAMIENYYKEEKAKDNKFKLSTPYGKCGQRKTTIWNYEEDTLLQYCKDNGLNTLYKTEENINKEEIKKHFKNSFNGNSILANADGEVMIALEDIIKVTAKEAE